MGELAVTGAHLVVIQPVRTQCPPVAAPTSSALFTANRAVSSPNSRRSRPRGGIELLRCPSSDSIHRRDDEGACPMAVPPTASRRSCHPEQRWRRPTLRLGSASARGSWTRAIASTMDSMLSTGSRLDLGDQHRPPAGTAAHSMDVIG